MIIRSCCCRRRNTSVSSEQARACDGRHQRIVSPSIPCERDMGFVLSILASCEGPSLVKLYRVVGVDKPSVAPSFRLCVLACGKVGYNDSKAIEHLCCPFLSVDDLFGPTSVVCPMNTCLLIQKMVAVDLLYPMSSRSRQYVSSELVKRGMFCFTVVQMMPSVGQFCNSMLDVLTVERHKNSVRAARRADHRGLNL